MRGRYAPSPTGDLHLGNASTALLAWLSVRAQRGRFVLRVEDLDPNRSRPEWQARQLEDLRWLGLDWDEGPDVDGPHPPYLQSQRSARYREVLAQLSDQDLLYPCFCSRKEIAAAAGAPQEPGDELPYPGFCRRMDRRESEALLAREEPHALRIRAQGLRSAAFEDRVRGPQPATVERDDFVVRRRDATCAYQLAVVIDDHDMEIDEVVRGDDLLSSTPKQLLLYRALGWRSPRFGHVPMLLGSDGARLSKRHKDITLREFRDAGWDGPALVGRLAALLQLRERDTPIEPEELVKNFDLSRIPRADGGVEVPTGLDGVQ